MKITNTVATLHDIEPSQVSIPHVRVAPHQWRGDLEQCIATPKGNENKGVEELRRDLPRLLQGGRGGSWQVVVGRGSSRQVVASRPPIKSGKVIIVIPVSEESQ